MHATPSLFTLCVLTSAMASRAAVPTYDYEIIHVYPHDTSAFTEGLFYLNGFLYESTGLEQHSSIRKVRLETGKVVQQNNVPPPYCAVGFVHDLKTFKLLKQFRYEGEGWALTQDGKQLLMSDGSPEIRLLNPQTLLPTGRIKLTLEAQPSENL